MSAYQTDQFARDAIDLILKRNATRQANLGEEDTEEMKALKQEAKDIWEEDLKIITVIDPEFWGVIREQE